MRVTQYLEVIHLGNCPSDTRSLNQMPESLGKPLSLLTVSTLNKLEEVDAMIFQKELNAKKPALNATTASEPTGALYPAIEPFKYPLQEPKIFRIKQVINTTGIARSTLYAKIATGEFPRPVSLGSRSVGWRSQDIYDFMAKLTEKGA